MNAKSARANILLVDDAPDTLDIVGRHLRAGGFGVTTALGARPALAHLERDRFDLVITDLKMPDLSGMELLRRVREGFMDTEVIMITGYASIQGAVEAVKSGAAEYLAKPFTRDELMHAVERALEKLARARKEREAATPPVPYRFGLVGRSAPITAACDALDRASQGRRAILILGERGTGRTTAALGVAGKLEERGAGAPGQLRAAGAARRALRAGGGRARRRAAGARHGRGDARAGRGAHRARQDPLPGRGPAAHHRLHAPRARWRDPRDRQGAPGGAFGGDAPPLRDRQGDVALLLAHFAAAAQEGAGRGGQGAPLGFGAEALAACDAYSWPGNVAELRDMVLDLAARARTSPVELRDLPDAVRIQYNASARSLREVEEEHIRRVLARAGDNKSRAAEILGINRKTLGEKLKGLTPPGGV